MNRTSVFLIAILGIAVAVALSISRQGPPSQKTVSTVDQALSPVLIRKLVLDATIKDGKLSGHFFNPNAGVTVTTISVEAMPKSAGGSSAKPLPRIFNITATAQPQATSSEFSVDARGLDPAMYTLRITGALGKTS